MYSYMYTYAHIIECHHIYSVGKIIIVSSWNLVMNSVYSYVYHSTCIALVYSTTALDLWTICIVYNFLAEFLFYGFTKCVVIT